MHEPKEASLLSIQRVFKQIRRHVRIWSKWRTIFTLFWWWGALCHQNLWETRYLRNEQEEYPSYASRNGLLKVVWCVAQKLDPRPNRTEQNNENSVFSFLQHLVFVIIESLKLVTDTLHRVQVKEHFQCLSLFSFKNCSSLKRFSIVNAAVKLSWSSGCSVCFE